MIVSRGYPTERYKGHGIFEFDQAKAIASLGHEVIFASVDMRSIRRWRKWGIEKLEKDGIQIYGINFPLGRIPKSILSFFSYLGLKILYKKIERERGEPDIMHSHFTEISYAASKLKDNTGIPLVITEHSSQINKEKIDEYLYKIAKITYKNADSIIAVSPSLINIIKRHFNIKPIYIPNIVDLDVFKYENRIENSKFNFVSTGNLIDLKRMDLTIQAFYEAFVGKQNVTLTIFGDGPKKRFLEELITEYNLNSQVRLMGSCPREQIAEELKKSDCFVLASQSETFGVAYIEGLAMGVPVIATRCGGPEAFVNDKNGLLIDINNKEQLVNAMKYMYANISKFIREEIYKEIVNEFSPKAVAKRIVLEYKKVLGI